MSALDLLTRGLAQASGLSLATRGLLVVRDTPPAPGIEVFDRRVDVRLVFSLDFFDADLAVIGGDLAPDNGLETAILLSLFTDARATPEEMAVYGATEDPRGWCGDAEALVEGDEFGSKLWLLERSKQTGETLARAQEYAEAALRWIVEDRVAERVTVQALYPRQGLLGLVVEVIRGSRSLGRFGFVWE